MASPNLDDFTDSELAAFAPTRPVSPSTSIPAMLQYQPSSPHLLSAEDYAAIMASLAPAPPAAAVQVLSTCCL
jgi:hypothetical protein